MEGENNAHKHFRMKIVKQHTKPLGRLLHEALRIGNEIAGGKKILNNLEEYSRCFIPMLETVRNPLNPNPSRPGRTQQAGTPKGTPSTSPDPPKTPEKNIVPGTQLDLDDFDEMMMMKRKMIDDLEDEDTSITHRSKRPKMTHSKENTQTYTHRSKRPYTPARPKHSTHTQEDTHTQPSDTNKVHKHSKGAQKQSNSTHTKNPLRSSSSRNLKTSKRGTKDAYVGENIKRYFTILRSGGADRNDLKGKTGISLGNQERDGDEMTGDNPSGLIQGGPKAVKTNTQVE